MTIQVLKQQEINEVSGGAITVGGPGLSLSLDPFALVGGLLAGVLGTVNAVATAVFGLVGGANSLVGVVLGVVTGLLGAVTTLV